MQKVIVIGGPTASGKTALSVEMAKRYPIEIISADSMQVYREMDIATAKPTEDEKQGIPHYLLDVVSPEQLFSAADYVRLAEKAIGEISGKGKIPLVCGGTGFYIKALLEGVNCEESYRDEKIRTDYENYAKEFGKQKLWELLKEKDPKRAEQIHPNNLVRVIRALEIIAVTGIKASKQSLFQKGGRYDVLYMTLQFQNREILNDRIDRRVDRMIEKGLREEAKRILDMNIPENSTAWQAIGYKEFKEYRTDEEAIAAIKLRSRQYAKRQETWFRAVKDRMPIDMSKGMEYAVKNASDAISAFIGKE